MAAVQSIDSNVTGLRYAEEASYKVLPGTPNWVPLEPNSYNDFGGSITTTARNPINPSRQRKKGVVTDLDAAGGFNTDLTQTNLQELLQGFFFADLVRKGEEVVTAVDTDTINPDEYEVASTTGFTVGALIEGQNFTNPENNTVNVVTAIVADTSVEVADGTLVAEPSPPSDAQIVVVGHTFSPDDGTAFHIDVSGDLPQLITDLVDFTTLGLSPGEWIYIGGDTANSRFFNSENNGFKRIRSITSTTITFDKSSSAMVTDDGSDTGSGGTFDLTIEVYFGRVLKNQLGSSIVRRSYNLERQLGAPDDASPAQIQAEYLEGAIPSELTFQVPNSNKLTVDLSFVAGDHTQIDGPTSLKSGDRPALVEADAFNTASDFARIKLATVDDTNEAPSPLFAFAEELSIGINNNLSPNKAVGTLGAFEIAAGTFQVSGNITAYFADVAAVQSVRNNSDITLDIIMVKSNSGIAVDLPLITLGDGRLNVQQDQSIRLPLVTDAATGAKVDSNLDHTLLMVFFDYLPTLALTVT